LLLSALIKFRKWEKEQVVIQVDSIPLEHHLALAAQRACREITLEITQKLSRDYDGHHNQLNFNNIYMNALSDLISDLEKGLELAGYIDYLGFYLPGVTTAEYRKHHRTFDDLATYVRKKFIKLMKK